MEGEVKIKLMDFERLRKEANEGAKLKLELEQSQTAFQVAAVELASFLSHVVGIKGVAESIDHFNRNSEKARINVKEGVATIQILKA